MTGQKPLVRYLTRNVPDTHDWLPTGHETLACQFEGCGLGPEAPIHVGTLSDLVRNWPTPRLNSQLQGIVDRLRKEPGYELVGAPIYGRELREVAQAADAYREATLHGPSFRKWKALSDALDRLHGEREDNEVGPALLAFHRHASEHGCGGVFVMGYGTRWFEGVPHGTGHCSEAMRLFALVPEAERPVPIG